MVVGTACFARWSVDNVWYNAVVERLLSDSVLVTFSDYGNSDEVATTNVLTELSSLPIGALIDENIKTKIVEKTV